MDNAMTIHYRVIRIRSETVLFVGMQLGSRSEEEV